jgi:hypothetical protein
VYNIDLSYRRMKIEAELNSQWWRIKPGEVALQTNHNGSITSGNQLPNSLSPLGPTTTYLIDPPGPYNYLSH